MVIGLGGTGQTVIRDIKKRMLRTYGEIPPLVQFIEFDTDEPQDDGKSFEYYYDGRSYRDFKYRISENEFLKIPSPSVEVVANDNTCKQKLNIDELRKVAGRLQGHGACGYRVMGRAHFINAAQQIINRLNNTVTTLRNANIGAAEQARGYNVGNNGITVYVIASLAGGTGSSAFQDMSRMLQIAGINAPIDKIFGMFFLPRFFEGKPNTDNIFKNAYTALSELDYTFDLADATRHPIGARELDEDNQDYNGYPNNGKRVVYDSIFLIDSLTSNAHTHTLPEASNYVASFIASSIAADAQALTSSFVNSNHKMNNVDGKYQNYSGLGYCELRFNRQELVEYLLNRKLIDFMEEFSNGPANFSPYKIVDNFINSNQLNEGSMPESEGDEDTRAQLNQLIDSIIDMNERSLTGYTMAAVDTGKEAATNINTSKIAYLRQIGTITQELIKNFATRKATLLQNLRNFLDDNMTGLGFGKFPEIAQDLKTIITNMKQGLEDEIEQHKTKFEGIEKQLQILSNTIAENSSKGWLGIGNKQEEQQIAINQYCKLVRFNTATNQQPTLAWLKVETTRKNEAVGVYEDMLKIIDTYYKQESIDTVDGPQVVIKGIFNSVFDMYKTLKSTLLSKNNSYKPSKAAVNETIFADAYFKDYFEENGAGQLNLGPQEKASLNEKFSSVLKDLPQASQAIANLRNQLLDSFPDSDLIKKIARQEISIDQLFMHCYGKYGDIYDTKDLDSNPQLKLLSQVRLLFDTLWCYHNFNGQGLTPVKNMVVGVYDTANNIFQQGGYSATIGGWSRYDYINLGDPDRIAFMLMETAIPAFKLLGVDSWANDFALHRKNTYTFTDKRMENIVMIMPGMNDEAEIAWAYGWMFGLICNPKNKRGLRVKPTIAYLNKNSAVAEKGGTYDYFKTLTQSSDIAACHNKFINDPDLSGDIYNQVMDKIDHDPINSIKRLKKWVNTEEMWSSDARGKNRESMTQEEQGVIQKEIVYLQKCFTRLGDAYGLRLESDGRITHYDNPSLIDDSQDKTEA